MTSRDSDLLALRYIEVEAELRAILEGRVVDGDPAAVEAALNAELEEIEFKLGEVCFERRDAK